MSWLALSQKGMETLWNYTLKNFLDIAGTLYILKLDGRVSLEKGSLC